jgi:hypothetical protein
MQHPRFPFQYLKQGIHNHRVPLRPSPFLEDLHLINAPLFPQESELTCDRNKSTAAIPDLYGCTVIKLVCLGAPKPLLLQAKLPRLIGAGLYFPQM